MTTTLWLVFGVAGMWLLGAAVVQLLATLCGRLSSGGKPLTIESRAEPAGLSLILGVGATAWLLFVWSLAGGPLGSATSGTLAALGSVLGGLAILKMGQGKSSERFVQREGEVPAEPRPAVTPPSGNRSAREDRSPFAAPQERRPPGNRALPRVLKGLIAAVFVTVFVQALLTPQRLWDERAIFGIKAAVLQQQGSAHSELLHHPDFAQYHPRYPLLLPLAEQHIYGLLGEVNDRWSKLIPPLLGLGLTLAFAGVLTRHSGPSRGWLFALLLATVPSLTLWEYGLPSAQADAPVACLHGLSVLYAWDWLRSRRTSQGAGHFALVISGMAAGLTIFTKDEGIAFFLVDAVALAVIACLFPPRGGGTQASPRWHGFIAAVVYAFTAAAVVAPWFWHRRGLPATTEMTYFARLTGPALADGLATLNWSLRHLASRMFREGFEWGLQWWGMLLASVLAPLRALTPPQLFLLLDILGALAAIIVAGMLAPTPVEEHLGGSSHRYLIQLAPAAVLFFAGQFIDPIQTEDKV